MFAGTPYEHIIVPVGEHDMAEYRDQHHAGSVRHQTCGHIMLMAPRSIARLPKPSIPPWQADRHPYDPHVRHWGMVEHAPAVRRNFG